MQDSGFPGQIDDEGAIHHEQRLGGQHAGGAAADDEVGVGHVEDREDVEDTIPKAGHIDASSAAVELVILIVLGDLSNRQATTGLIQLPTDLQHRIPDGLGLQSLALGPPHQTVFDVDGNLFGVGLGTHLVGP